MKPLISIGIPTYNRSSLLANALKHLADQDYPNIEVIVGDNSDHEVTLKNAEICSQFKASFQKLRHCPHAGNKGAFYNFNFVFEQSTGEYFMWLADDYSLSGKDYLSTLESDIHNNTLIFPLFILSNKGEEASRAFFSGYERLSTPWEYLKAWCKNGAGYPVYGLYNRSKLVQSGALELNSKCREWVYFNEGLFLHKLFISGLVKYCPRAKAFADTSFSNFNASEEEKLLAFCRYFFESVKLFTEAELTEAKKSEILDILVQEFSKHYRYMLEESFERKNNHNKLSLYRRLRTSARILLRGN